VLNKEAPSHSRGTLESAPKVRRVLIQVRRIHRTAAAAEMETSDLTFLQRHVHLSTMGITDHQQAILDFSRDFCADNGVMRLLRDTRDTFKFGTSRTTQKRLHGLEKKGVIQRSGGRARSTTVVGTVPFHAVHIPLVGIIPAGYPSEQDQQSDRCVSIDEETLQLPKNARTFALEVRGDSMIDAHIVAGDVVIMELREPNHRDIVAALIDGETTLKRFLVHKGKPFLRAENSKYPDLVPAQELVIQGVFRALLRVDKRLL
jgi:repressor LexA